MKFRAGPDVLESIPGRAPAQLPTTSREKDAWSSLVTGVGCNDTSTGPALPEREDRAVPPAGIGRVEPLPASAGDRVAPGSCAAVCATGVSDATGADRWPPVAVGRDPLAPAALERPRLVRAGD
jgi:hypothetical protein